VHPATVEFDEEQHMKNSTYSRIRPTVSTVKKSHANIPAA
jgi:hypothetical protein